MTYQSTRSITEILKYHIMLLTIKVKTHRRLAHRPRVSSCALTLNEAVPAGHVTTDGASLIHHIIIIYSSVSSSDEI